MSTRATYLISSSNWDKLKICFYIHYDGYPEGAAEYFWNMHHNKNNRGGYAGRFIRSNDLAEFTLSHESHGDTEYRYTLSDKGELTALARNGFSDNWHQFYKGIWYEFVNKYISDKEKLYAFKISEISNENLVMTLTEAKKYIDDKIEEIKVALSKGWNVSSLEKYTNHIKNQVDDIMENNETKGGL